MTTNQGSISATFYTGTANNSDYLGEVPANNYVNTSGSYVLTGVLTFNANLNINTTAAVIANGSVGTAGQVLTTNTTGVYWSTVSGGGGGTVTSVDSSNGISGGPITSSGSLYINANTGIIANVTGVFVDSTYIGTLSANNTTYVNGKTEANLNVNNSVTSNTANNTTNFGGLSLATVQSQITGNASTAYANAVSNAAGLYAPLAGATFTGAISAPNVTTTSNTLTIGTAAYHVANGNLGIGNTTPAYKLTIGGSLYVSDNTNFVGTNNFFNTIGQFNAGIWRSTAAGPAYWMQQDGTGRSHWYWNTSGGGSPTFAAAAEDASALSLSITNSGAGGFLLHRSASGVGKVAGDAITWTNTLYVDLNIITWKGTAIAVANGSTYNLVANNSSYLGGTIASGYQTTAGLSANVATLSANNTTYVNGKTEANLNVNNSVTSNTANNSSYLGGTIASGYQTTAGLSANVATLSSNNSSYLGGTIASGYQTTAGLSANVATLSSNNSSYLGGTIASGYQTTAGLSANVATLSSNNSSYLGGTIASGYQTTAGLSANVATLAANNTTYVNGKTEANLNVNNATTATSANNSSYLGGTIASGYQTTAGLSANVATLSSNNSTYFGGYTWAAPAALGGSTANTGNFTTVSLSDRITQTGTVTNAAGYIQFAGQLNSSQTGQQNMFTMQSQVSPQGAGALGSLYGLLFLPTIVSSANNITNINGVFGRVDSLVSYTGTVTNLNTFTAGTPSWGSATAIGNIYQFTASDATATTFVMGYRSQISAGANKWGYYGSGTANNYMNGGLGIGTATLDAKLTVSGTANISGAVALASTLAAGNTTITGFINVSTNAIFSGGIIANGSIGTAGQILASNSTGIYWASAGGTGTVTSVGSGNGLTGGPITTTGSLSVLANSGIVSNSTGVFVNTAYIGTLSANNTTYVNGKTEANLNVNNATTATTANNSSYLGGTIASGYQTTAGLSANVATLAANSTTYVLANSGIVSNSTGVFVNTAYIGTLSSNNTTYVNGKTEANLNVNNATTATTANNSSYLGGTIASGYQTTAGLSANVATLTANNSTNLGGVAASGYQTTAGLSANVATLSSNNSSYLGGVAAANYVNTSGSYTITGIHTLSANLVITGSATSGIIANGTIGTAGQVLSSNGSSVYWASAGSGSGTVTSISSGNGLTGGPVTTTGTLSVLANSGIIANTTGVFVDKAAQYIWSNTQTFQNTITYGSNILVGTSVNAASYNIGSAFIANTTGITSTGYANVTGSIYSNTYFANSKINVGTAAGFDFGTSALVELDGSGNTFVQIVIQNANTFLNASSDLVVTSDTGNNTQDYVDLGINSSTYSNALYTISGSNDGYLYASNGALAIGTAAAKAVLFHANGTLSTDEKMRISANGNVGIGNTAPVDKLSVGGTIASGNTTITGFANVSTSVNTALLTVGTAFTANATLVNAAAVNITGQTNTATLYVTTSANVGTAFIANTSQVFFGNSISNTTLSNTSLTMLSNSAFLPQIIVRNSTVDTFGPYWNTGKSRAGGIVVADDDLGTFMFQGHDGNTFVNSAWLVAEADGSPVANSNFVPSRLTFLVSNTSASSSRFSINSTSTTITGLLAAGNTTITGFANIVSDTAAIQVGNSTSYFSGNTTGFYPVSNTSGSALGNTTARWVITGQGGTFGGTTSFAGLTVTGTLLNSGANGNFGSSTAAATYQLGYGATTTGVLKTINLGTGGAAGSTTNVNIGSTLSNTFVTINANTATVTGAATITGILTQSANIVMSNNYITNPGLQSYKEFATNTSISITTSTLDLSTTNIFNLTLANATITLTFNNPPAGGTLYSFTIFAKQDATGSRVITWPTTVKWPNGVTPTMSTTANKNDVFTFMTIDGGTTYLGGMALANVG